MTSSDLTTCRRALREIREIAAVAHLADSQMTDEEALRSISAIAQWVRDVAALERGGAECGALVRRLNGLLAPQDLKTLDDQAAEALFEEVADALQAPRPPDPDL